MTTDATHDLAIATAEAVLAMARLVQPSEREPFDALRAALIAARASTPEANDPPPGAQEWSVADVREATQRAFGLKADGQPTLRNMQRVIDGLESRLATVEAERDAAIKQRNDLKNRWCEATEECGNLRARIAASRRPPPARMPSVEELVEIMEREMQRLGGTLDQVSWMRAALYSVARAVHSAASAAQPAGGVPQELLDRLPDVQVLADTLRNGWTRTWSGSELNAVIDLLRWAHSQPAAPPVAEWQKQAREIVSRLDSPGYTNNTYSAAAALCREIAGTT